MLNFTLTITAAPELLAAISSLTNSITSAKVVTIPERSSEYATSNDGSSINNHSSTHAITYPIQNPNTQHIQTAAVPTSTQSYTMEQLAVAATQLVDAGRRSDLVGLLNTFGVQALTALPKEQYGAFATQLRTLGAKIDNLCVQKRNAEGSKI